MQLSVVRSSLLAGFVLLACSSEPFPEDQAEKTATARFHLETGNPTGNIFKLEKGVFKLTGPTNTSVTSDPLGPWVEVDVVPGAYSILLEKGWELHHVGGPGFYQSSDAKLVSPNPQLITLPAGQVTDVIFKFSFGDTVPGQNEARARIGIEVEEPVCGNGVVDPGEECDKFGSNPTGATCDALCTGGGKGCAQDTDCASGKCTQGNCPNCQTDADACHTSCQSSWMSCSGNCVSKKVTCKTGCESSETTCRNVCGAASAACWAGCWFDPVGCAIACEPPRTLCMDQCTSARTNCSTGCDTADAACMSPCAAADESCDLGCEQDQKDCVMGCNKCVSCTDANQCPYLKK